MNALFTIDDGTREYTLVNQYGQEICRLHFRPNDISLYDRYLAMRDKFTEIVKPLEQIGINADGTASAEEGLAILKEAETAFRAQLRELLDSDDADAAFEKRNPFSSVGGRFFCAIVTDAIGKMIEAAYAEEAKATAEKTAQYIEEEGNDAGQTAANA